MPNPLSPLIQDLLGQTPPSSLFSDYIIPSSAGYGPGYNLAEKRFFEPRQLTGGPPGASYLDQSGNVLKFNEYVRPHNELLTLPASPSRRLQHVRSRPDASGSEGVIPPAAIEKLFEYLIDQHPSNRPEINPYAPGYDEGAARDRRLNESYEQAVREVDAERAADLRMPGEPPGPRGWDKGPYRRTLRVTRGGVMVDEEGNPLTDEFGEIPRQSIEMRDGAPTLIDRLMGER